METATLDVETLETCTLCESRDLHLLDAATGICRCASCGYIFDNPRPTADAIRRFYSRPTKYDGWLRAEGPRDALWKRRLAKLAPTRKPGSLLDVGTGIGQFLHHARAVYTEVHGTEISTRAIEIAKEKFALAITEGPIETAPLGDRRFDNITLFHVLEHVGNPRTVIARCHELLTPGGMLTVAVPNDVLTLRAKPDKLGRLTEQLRTRGRAAIDKPALPRITLDGSMDEIHLSHFTTDVLARFLASSGFTVVEQSLDPYWVANGLDALRQAAIYATCRVVHRASGINVYETIWLSARKN
jgi:ubiquinone/menaquinone biosynthesis C-methylase UbiE